MAEGNTEKLAVNSQLELESLIYHSKKAIHDLCVKKGFSRDKTSEIVSQFIRTYETVLHANTTLKGKPWNCVSSEELRTETEGFTAYDPDKEREVEKMWEDVDKLTVEVTERRAQVPTQIVTCIRDQQRFHNTATEHYQPLVNSVLEKPAINAKDSKKLIEKSRDGLAKLAEIDKTLPETLAGANDLMTTLAMHRKTLEQQRAAQAQALERGDTVPETPPGLTNGLEQQILSMGTPPSEEEMTPPTPRGVTNVCGGEDEVLGGSGEGPQIEVVPSDPQEVNQGSMGDHHPSPSY